LILAVFQKASFAPFTATFPKREVILPIIFFFAKQTCVKAKKTKMERKMHKNSLCLVISSPLFLINSQVSHPIFAVNIEQNSA